MFYVYRFLDKKENIIYVGKSKQGLEQRFRGHLHLPEACYELVYKIEYIECATESDMSIKEIYYINKYRNEGVFFNVLDTADVPKSIEFVDKWQQYKGPLGAHFCHSINYIKGYTSKKAVRYNKDGSMDQRKPNSEKGVSNFVEGFTGQEVDLICEHFINELNSAENDSQEQIRFRNLAIFILGVNIPHKSNDLLSFRYCDLFDQNDCLKAVELKLNRSYKDEIIQIPLKDVVKKTISAYTQYCGFNYADNATDVLFQTREHQTMSPRIWWRILNRASVAVGIEKNTGSESLRKTFGLNIFNRSVDKLNALVFLEKIWGGSQYGDIIGYLKLTDDSVDYDYYFGEKFSLGEVDVSKIRCIQTHTTFVFPSAKVDKAVQNEIHVDNQLTLKKTPAKRGAKEVKMYSKEKKLEIVLKHINQNIPQNDLVKEYGVDKTCISRWVNGYKNYGELAFEDMRRKSKNDV